MEWLRLYSEILNDSKIMLLPENYRWRYVALLCIASESKERGTIPSDEEVLFKLRISEDEWGATLQAFIQRGLVEKENGVCKIHAWHQRQYTSDDSTPRVQKHRSKTADVADMKRYCNVTVTPPDTDTETDTEEDKTPQGGRPRANLLDRELPHFLKGASILNEQLTELDFTTGFRYALRDIIGAAQGGSAKFLRACENLARAPDDDRRCVKSVTWLLEDRRKALNRVVTWAAKNGQAKTVPDSAPADWRPRQ